MERGNIRLLGLILFYIIYLAIGAAVFYSIESPLEKDLRLKLQARREKFLAKHPCLSEHELDSFMMEVLTASQHGVSPAIKNVSDIPNWGYDGSFFFAGALITTIGYGNIAPISLGGKVFCVVYALFGIPMTAIMLTAIVERLLVLADRVEKFLSRTCTVKGIPLTYLRFLHLVLIMLVVVLTVLFLPALLFMHLEGWNYFEAFYFCFISLTTIGLGDFVPGETHGWQSSKYRSLYKVFCVFYFICGLSFLILVLEICAMVPDDHPDMLFSCHKPFLKDEEGEELVASKDGGLKNKTRTRRVIPGFKSSSSSESLGGASKNGYRPLSEAAEAQE